MPRHLGGGQRVVTLVAKTYTPETPNVDQDCKFGWVQIPYCSNVEAKVITNIIAMTIQGI